MGNTYNRVYIWCCKNGENRYCERCANKWWCASKHTGLLNKCLGKWYQLPYLAVPLISARVPLISTRVSAHWHQDNLTITIHYDDVIMTMLASQITSLTVVYSIVYSGVNQRKHQSSASLAFVRESHRGPVNFLHKWPVTRKMFPFDDVIMCRVNSPHEYIKNSFTTKANNKLVHI